MKLHQARIKMHFRSSIFQQISGVHAPVPLAGSAPSALHHRIDPLAVLMRLELKPTKGGNPILRRLRADLVHVNKTPPTKSVILTSSAFPPLSEH